MNRDHITLLVGMLVVGGCGSASTPEPSEPVCPSSAEQVPANRPAESATWPAVGAAPADLPGLPHLLAVSPRLAVGGRPDGRVGFDTLRRLGVSVVVSVDGQRPQLEAARAAGLTYVHIPTGYGGISPGEAAALARVVRQYPTQRIYLHCHHGQHRGPAAAAVALRADEPTCSAERVRALLARAGTSRDYAGLWRDAEAVELPAAVLPLERLPPLVEAVTVDSLTAVMVEIDDTWHVLGGLHKNHWKTRPEHPDQTAESQARRLAELLRAAAELPDGVRPAAHRDLLRKSADPAEQLAQALAEGRLGVASGLMPMIRSTCTDCHRQYRN